MDGEDIRCEHVGMGFLGFLSVVSKNSLYDRFGRENVSSFYQNGSQTQKKFFAKDVKIMHFWENFATFWVFCGEFLKNKTGDLSVFGMSKSGVFGRNSPQKRQKSTIWVEIRHKIQSTKVVFWGEIRHTLGKNSVFH